MRVGITFSSFDLFHAGHVKMIEEAKLQCEYLIVGLQLIIGGLVDLEILNINEEFKKYF